MRVESNAKLQDESEKEEASVTCTSKSFIFKTSPVF